MEPNALTHEPRLHLTYGLRTSSSSAVPGSSTLPGAPLPFFPHGGLPSPPLPPQPGDSASPARPSTCGTSSVKPSWLSLPGSCFPVELPRSPYTSSHCMTVAPSPAPSATSGRLPSVCAGALGRRRWLCPCEAPGRHCSQGGETTSRDDLGHTEARTQGQLTWTAVGRTRRVTVGRRGHSWSKAPAPAFPGPQGAF